MTTNNRTVGIFMMPQQFPCGPQSSCCGPVGQSEGEIHSIKSAIEERLGCQVEVFNVTTGKDMKNYLQIVRLLRSFGPMALPIIALSDEVVSMGNPTPDQIVSAIRDKMNQM